MRLKTRQYDLESDLEIYLQIFYWLMLLKNMKTYWVKCRKNTKNLNSKIFKTKKGRLIMQSKFTECGFKKSRFVKEKEAKGLISNLNPIDQNHMVKCFILRCIKMNEIVNKFLLTGDKFMPELHLKQLGFTCSASGPFSRNKKKNWKIHADRKYRFYLQKWAG